MGTKPEIRPMSPRRRIIVDGGRWLSRRYPMYGIAEWDVTEARRRIARHEASQGSTISFTGWIVRCVAEAVSENIETQAMLDWRGRLVVFPGVDVLLMVESAEGEGRVPVGHVVRNAAAKSVFEITCEIRAAQSSGVGSRTGLQLRRAGRLPTPVRWAAFSVIKRSPRLFQRLGGTVAVSSVGMFGGGVRWGLVPLHTTIGITIGGIEARDDRELLALTLGIDHDIVDGGPAARLASRLRELVESASGLPASGASEVVIAHPEVGSPVVDDVEHRVVR